MLPPDQFEPNRTFIKKARSFIKYYPPLVPRDPEKMLQESLSNLAKLVNSSLNTSQLENLSEEARAMINHPNEKEYFQFPVEDERYRFIIYRPCKFFEKENKKIEIYDLLYIPPTSNRP